MKRVKHLEQLIDSQDGTAFQKEVWKAITTIPKGETRSYGELAKQIGRPKACRAVANACGKNPLAPAVPCHRVIASDGSIGGFTGASLAKKKELLASEGVKI